MIKKCTLCQKQKPISQFHKQGKGWRNWCKQCRKEREGSQAKERYHKRKLCGRCAYCGGVPLVGKILCSDCADTMSKYRKKRKLYHNKYNRKYQKMRRDTDPVYKLMWYIRKRVRQTLNCKGIKKKTKTIEGIGCSPEELKCHIESQFEENMTWDNYGIGDGEWSIDHIYPMYLCKTEEEIIKNNHYTNLRPMWHKDNLARTYEEIEI
jgi:hypothetical protein